MSLMPPSALFLIVLLTLTGCFSTHLTEQEPAVELERLVQSTQHRMGLSVFNPQRESSHGYQFLMGIVPLSRIFAENLNNTVTAQLQYHAGVAGIGLTEGRHSHHQQPILNVVISSVAINGYDLIVFRRPSALITLKGTLSTPSGTVRSCEESAEQTETTRFAFSPQLNQVLTSAVSTAAERLIHCLGLSWKGEPENTTAPANQESGREP